MASHSHHGQPLPRRLLTGAAALLLFTFVVSGISKVTGVGRTALADSPVVDLRRLLFEDAANGAVTVRDADSAQTIATLAPGSNGFIRSVMRGMARERKRRGLSAEQPFELARLADGRLSLSDPATGRTIALEAFGPDNAVAFAQLLARPGAVSTTASGQNDAAPNQHWSRASEAQEPSQGRKNT